MREMRITTYPDAGSYLDVAQNYLEKDEALNNLPLGLACRLRDQKEVDPPPLYLTAADDNDLALAALMTPPHNLILYSDRADVELAPLVRHLVQSTWTVPGVLGPTRLAGRFARAWEEATNRSNHIKTRLRVYQLTAVEHRGSAPGHFRAATPADLDLLARWSRDFGLAIDEPRGDLESIAPAVLNRIAAGNLFIWEDGKPVSMAAYSRPTSHGTAINEVYTPPEFRNHGYATACVAALSQHQLDRGHTFCALFADLDNPISNSIYQKIGYRPIGDFDQIEFA
jgi:uncharacterized protein